MATEIPASCNNMAFFVKGPWENYNDRAASAEVGLYTGKVNDFVYHYVKPQECSNRTEVRWLTLNNDKGQGLEIKGTQHLNTSVWPWTAETLDVAQHTNELKAHENLTVNIDHMNAGVGGTDSWSSNAQTIEKYRIKAGEYHFNFTIKPLK